MERAATIKKKTFITVYLLVFLVPSWLAQSIGHLIDASLSQFYYYTVIQYSNRSGLPGNQIFGIVRGEKGGVILGTSSGIVSFNGSQFKMLVPNSSYSDDMYTSLLWIEKQKILFGASRNRRLVSLLPEFHELGIFSSYTTTGDTLLTINDSGEVWLSGLNHLKLYKKWSTGIKQARSILWFKDRLYIASATGLWQFAPGEPNCVLIKSDPCRGVYKNDYDDKLYLLTNRSFYRINEKGFQTVFNLTGNDTLNYLTSIAILGSEDFFIGSSNGIYRVFPEYVDYYNEDNIIPAARVQAMYYDTLSNSLFAATAEKGMLQLIAKTCRTILGKGEFKKGGSVGSIIRTEAGETIMNEVGGYLYKLRPASVEMYGDETGSYASLAEIDGLIYAGTWGGGIKLFKNRTFVGRITGPAHFQDNVVFATFKDSRGNIWVGTRKGVSMGKDTATLKPVLRDQHLEMANVFYELRNGNICIGAAKSFIIINPKGNVVKKCDQSSGLKCRTVRSFYEDAQGKLWIGTYGGGVYCFYNGKLRSINDMPNCMLDADAFCLAPDDMGYIYMTSNHGLWKVKQKDLNDFYEAKLPYLVPYYYGEESGIQNTEFNGGFQNNYLLSPYGHFYFPSVRGPVVAVPEQENEVSPEVSIERVTVNDTLYRGTNAVLKRSTFSVGFDFTAQTFTEKSNLYYQYRLSGTEYSQWSELQKKGSISFKLLPPGTYSFEVRALDASNTRNPRAEQFVFTIEHSIYETIWFRALLMSLVSLLIFLFTYLYVQRSRRRTVEKEKIKRQVAELELKAVESQMNPHFVFNSLNSIKYYLTVNNTAMADRCLDHFSRLLRDFLEHGAHDFIRAEKESQILNSYLELEKQRINPPFDFEIHLPDKLRDVMIPTHLLQPLVENAVKHGISHASYKGKLSIRFEMEDLFLRLTVEDNGIGRAMAAKINRAAMGTSKGLAIVKEKIRLVKELYALDIIYTVTDLTDQNNLSSGTRVELVIPINQRKNL